MNNSELYLRRTEAIDSEHETIKTVAEKLTSHAANEVEKAIELCYFVRDSIRYNIYMVSVALEDFRASAVLARGKGCCVQ